MQKKPLAPRQKSAHHSEPHCYDSHGQAGFQLLGAPKTGHISHNEGWHLGQAGKHWEPTGQWKSKHILSGGLILSHGKSRDVVKCAHGSVVIVHHDTAGGLPLQSQPDLGIGGDFRGCAEPSSVSVEASPCFSLPSSASFSPCSWTEEGDDRKDHAHTAHTMTNASSNATTNTTTISIMFVCLLKEGLSVRIDTSNRMLQWSSFHPLLTSWSPCHVAARSVAYLPSSSWCTAVLLIVDVFVSRSPSSSLLRHCQGIQ